MDNGILTLGVLIRQIRTARGWSLRDMGEAVGISHTQIDILEKGYDPRTGRRANTTVETLSKIAAATGEELSHFTACLDGTARVTLTRPPEMWHDDEREDYERASGDERALLRLKYGRPVVSFPASQTEARLKAALFGEGYPVTDAQWEQVKSYVEFLKQQP